MDVIKRRLYKTCEFVKVFTKKSEIHEVLGKLIRWLLEGGLETNRHWVDVTSLYDFLFRFSS